MTATVIKATTSWLPHVQRMLDGTVVTITLWVAQLLLDAPVNDRTWNVGFAGGLVFYVIGEFLGLYRASRNRNPDIELVATTLSWLMTLTVLSGIGFLTRWSDVFSRSSILAWFFLAGFGLLLSRMVFRAVLETFHRRGIGVRKTAIAGLNNLGVQVASNTRQHPECGLNIVGFYDDRELHRLAEVPDGGPGYCGSVDQMIADARAGKIDTVLITLPMRAEKRIQAIMSELADSTISVYIVPDFFVFELLHSRWSQVGGLPMVSVFESPLYGVDGLVKRTLDVCLAAIGLVLVMPVLLACALAVRLSGPGPIFFLQKRYGLDGREILVWKFRSMRTCDNGTVVKQATKDDPRVTRVGKFLRRSSLDELPQLFNVLFGNMSLVGPRPHANAHNEHYRRLIRGYMLRHKVKPGITGLAQVEGSRGETDTVDKMQTRIDLDHRYIREWSLWLDIKILFKTFWVVIKKEAY